MNQEKRTELSRGKKRIAAIATMLAVAVSFGLAGSTPSVAQAETESGVSAIKSTPLQVESNDLKISPLHLAVFENIVEGGSDEETSSATPLTATIGFNPQSQLLARVQARRTQRRKLVAPGFGNRVTGAALIFGEKGRKKLLSSPVDANESPSAYAVFNLEFDSNASCERFAVPGVNVFNRFMRWADVFVPYDDNVLQQILASPGLVWSELAQQGVIPPPPIAGPSETVTKGRPDAIIRGGRGGLTGKNVIVAVVDTGIDFRHPDFIRYDKNGRPTSRILAFWDTTSEAYGAGVGKRAPITYPNGAPVGTIYSQDDLTADLRSGRSRIASWDTDGHGTACAGIAAGNGNASKDQRYAGVAPEADIIAVRVAYPGDKSGLANSYLINAVCGWVDKVAGQRPAVVSCSFGGQFSGRDGQTIEERQLSARFDPTRKGRAICIAAGNEGELALHAETTFKGKAAPGLIDLNGYAWMEMYFDSDDASDILITPVGETQLRVLATHHHPLTNQLVSIVEADGEGLRLFNKSGKAMRVDVYADESDSFGEKSARAARQIASPGSAVNAITVGSYDWNETFNQRGRDLQMANLYSSMGGNAAPMKIGGLSEYSNPGPSRAAGVIKPDLIAPGQYFSAPYSMNVPDIVYGENGGALFSLRDSSGFYQLFNGTSAATPYTAGVLALLYEKKPDLTLAEFRSLLRLHASRDGSTGDLPNDFWGYGKLNVAAVDAMIKALK